MLVTLQSGLLNFELHDLPVRRIEVSWFAISFDPQMASRLIHHINGLVRQKPLINIAMRQFCRRYQRFVSDPHAVVHFIFFLQTAQDENTFLNRRLINKYWLKAPRKRRILFNIFAIFIKCGRTDTPKLTTC